MTCSQFDKDLVEHVEKFRAAYWHKGFGVYMRGNRTCRRLKRTRRQLRENGRL